MTRVFNTQTHYSRPSFPPREENEGGNASASMISTQLKIAQVVTALLVEQWRDNTVIMAEQYCSLLFQQCQ